MSTHFQPGGEPRDTWSGIGQDLKSTFFRTMGPVVLPLAAMWVLYFISIFVGNWLNRSLALQARELDGLIGILFMPLLHGGFGHILGNTMSWLVLGGMIALLTRRFSRIMVAIWLLSGAILWIIGTPWVCHAPEGIGCVGLHIGASAVVYGFAGFLVTYGFLARRVLAILFALFVLFFYGLSMIGGMMPFNSGGVSWTGHLSGAIAGVVVAFFFTKEARAERLARASSRRNDGGDLPPLSYR